MDPAGHPADSTGSCAQHRQQLTVRSQGHQWSCRQTTRFLFSPDGVHFSKNTIPEVQGHCMPQNFNYFYSGQRKTRSFHNRSGGMIPEWPSAIVKDARGKLLQGPAGSPTMNKNLISWPRVQLYESSLLFLSRNAKGDFLLKF